MQKQPWLRWHVLRTLLHKEVLRHLANRGGLVLVLLLIVAALLLSVFGNKNDPAGGGFMGGVKLCYVDYWEKDDWVRHLIDNVPPELEDRILIRHVRKARKAADGTIVYPQNTGGIQVRPGGGLRTNRGRDDPRYKVWVWHPGQDAASMAPFEAWFWKETRRFFQGKAETALAQFGPDVRKAVPTPAFEEERSQLKGGLAAQSGLATSLVMFGLFFVCVYLLPSLTCEERERGVLLAQALSPASAREILAAKFLFYPAVGMLLAAVLAGTYNPAVLLKPFFWLMLAVAVCGSMGIGLTIASVARTQRAASMGAMCYMLVVALMLFLCQQVGVPVLPYLALEYHCPRVLHAILADAVLWYHWWNLLGAALLACVWAVLATYLFRRHGWQT